ncbi:hypothetical protein EDD90_7606 [Streptomyces sp. Ag109_O5-1]|uniref:hypothetical protein n=1 Tax=Streptomyces sp. Ag109_O5-1 TaxID=1938851 RepID=UPI000FA6291C|nr:hypothetical protein [Streptomyces sp. Ag109_O5-1]RPE44367.1 hypothetical protein EDD90_7606 [Streptomyces sp. Ag109_O5-1]
MSVDREKQYMTQTETDIAFLLADATDEVEIGIAPVQAVMRGGRRRRARRWAMAAATAMVVLGGSAGATLAFAGLPGEHRAQEVAKPAPPEARHVYEPQRTEVSRGTYQGKEWHVSVQVWGAPRDENEADRQFDAMAELGVMPAEVRKPADLIGKMSFFATRGWGEEHAQQVMFNTVRKPESYAGTDLEAIATRFSSDPASSGRLVIGIVARTAQEVTCHWKDGRTSVAHPADGFSAHDDGNAIRTVDGFPTANWFVCVAPQGTVYQSAEVTK